MNLMEIKDQFDPLLRQIIKKQKRAAVIPVGSIEQHGAHLPLSTDSDIVSEIARSVSEKCDFVLLPTINYGVSFEHSPFFNLSIRGSTLQKLLVEVCLSLLANNIKTVFIINGHYGNQKSIQRLPQILTKSTRGKSRVFVLPYWHFMSKPFDHAGFVETSLMLTISKKVKMKKAKKGLVTDRLSHQKVAILKKHASKSFVKVAKTGVWGDPTLATVKDGMKILSEIVENLVKKCQTCLTDKNRKLHQ